MRGPPALRVSAKEGVQFKVNLPGERLTCLELGEAFWGRFVPVLVENTECTPQENRFVEVQVNLGPKLFGTGQRPLLEGRT